jgi:hypothetical protein
MKKILTIAAILLSQFMGLAQKEVSFGPTIEFEKETFIVKPINSDTLQVRFIVKNTGTQNLEIYSVKPSCGCTVVDFNSVIEPGKQDIIWVKIANPNPPFSKSVLVNSNDTKRPDVILYVKSEIE